MITSSKKKACIVIYKIEVSPIEESKAQGHQFRTAPVSN